MKHSIADALGSGGEHDWIDFKREFDTGSTAAWCEVVKDVVAMANSGGGYIIVGLDDDGTPAGSDIQAALALDPAVFVDKVRKYTGVQFASFSLFRCRRNDAEVLVIGVGGVQYPLVFTNAGTYELPDKKQGRAFSVGQVYFRHGAKSEPGVSDDLRQFVDREVSRVREEWLGNIRKVVEAPAGSVVSIAPAEALDVVAAGAAIPARLVHAEDAAAVPWRSPDVTHPYRQKEALVEINRRIEGKGRVNGFDVRLVRRHFKAEDDPNLVYKPKFGTLQYSPAFIDWLVHQFEQDPGFFTSLRETTKVSAGRVE